MLGLLMGLVGAPVAATDPGAGGPASAGDETLVRASRLLERMAAAQGSLDYQGTLVYLIDHRLETLRLVHRVGQDGVEERLAALNGPPRTLVRANDRVTCEPADGAPLRAARGARGVLAAPPIDPLRLAERYRIEVLGPARIAGRDTEVLRLRPRDGLRYGHQFYLDRESGLPLKADLIDERGEPLEQLLFTAIEFSAARALPPAAARRPADATVPPVVPDAARWRFEGRAPGFELALRDLLEDGQGRVVEHYLFSDQLSSYSVYIEDGAAEGLDGAARIGAVHAAGRLLDGHRVTAVGEVPAATVEAAVAGLRRDTGGP